MGSDDAFQGVFGFSILSLSLSLAHRFGLIAAVVCEDKPQVKPTESLSASAGLTWRSSVGRGLSFRLDLGF